MDRFQEFILNFILWNRSKRGRRLWFLRGMKRALKKNHGGKLYGDDSKSGPENLSKGSK